MTGRIKIDYNELGKGGFISHRLFRSVHSPAIAYDFPSPGSIVDGLPLVGDLHRQASPKTSRSFSKQTFSRCSQPNAANATRPRCGRAGWICRRSRGCGGAGSRENPRSRTPSMTACCGSWSTAAGCLPKSSRNSPKKNSPASGNGSQAARNRNNPRKSQTSQSRSTMSCQSCCSGARPAMARGEKTAASIFARRP